MTAEVPAFELDPRLAAGSVAIADWPLAHLRLKDDGRFPWLLLVPRLPHVVEITDLSDSDYRQLMEEIREATRLVIEIARPDKTNVATLGNLVSQLHVHVIGRSRDDAGWPRPVWCLEEGAPYRPEALAALAERYGSAAAARGTLLEM